MPEQNRDRKRAEQPQPLSDGRGSEQPQPLSHGRGSEHPAADGGPIAYFITFRTHGTWLHGDARGSVDREHNVPGTPLLPPDPRRQRKERELCRGGPVTFDADQRSVVQRTILAVCAHNDWSVHELNVRSNHVHLIVSAPQRPEQVMRSLKAWCTRRLKEAASLAPSIDPWSRHGSTRHLWKAESLAAACEYARDGQGPDL